MRWLTLLTSLPPTPTRHRVGVWRKLQRMGAVRLRSAGWILPETPETTELFQWLGQENQPARRGASFLYVDYVETLTEEGDAPPFPQARGVEVHPVSHGGGVPLPQPARHQAHPRP